MQDNKYEYTVYIKLIMLCRIFSLVQTQHTKLNSFKNIGLKSALRFLYLRDWHLNLKGQSLMICSKSCCTQSKRRRSTTSFSSRQPVLMHFTLLSSCFQQYLFLCPLLAFIQEFQSSWNLKDASCVDILLFMIVSLRRSLFSYRIRFLHW